MKLVVPYLSRVVPADSRLVKLAEFLGVQCQLLRLETGAAFTKNGLERAIPNHDVCLVVNPAVLSRCFANDCFPSALASYLLKRFSFLLVHNLRPDAMSASTVQALSMGRLQSITSISRPEVGYQVAPGTEELCCHFSGLSFGPADPANDNMLVPTPEASNGRTLIAIDGQPFFAKMQCEDAQVFFIAGTDIADLDAVWDGKSLTGSFSRLMPAAMVLRYVFGPTCWHPVQGYATLIIDDPLLQRNYGFLNYERVLAAMDRHNFHTSIAFIPYNCRRHSPAVARMFRERPDRYSICFHGNDHTAAEFAAQDPALLNSALRVAESRMGTTREITGIASDKVMVFPQGNFSRAAMQVLKGHDFQAAVNTVPYPRGEALELTIRDVLQPAVLKYAGFPLFLRNYALRLTTPQIALHLFFGKPIFMVEHHVIFKNLEPIIDLVCRINTLAPNIRWSNLRTAIENAWLQREAGNGTFQVRAYANAIRLTNGEAAPLRFSVEWPEQGQGVERILCNQASCVDSSIDDNSVRISLALQPGDAHLLSLVHRNPYGLSNANTRIEWVARAYVRRRLSEVRDNYLSKSPRLLSFAKFVRRSVLHKDTASDGETMRMQQA